MKLSITEVIIKEIYRNITEKALPVGTKRQRRDGVYEKIGSYQSIRNTEQELEAGVDPKSLDEKLVNRVKKLRALIENGPKFNGTISRGINVEQGFSDAVVGDDFSLKAMASFSKGESATGKFNDRNIILTILNSDNGIDVSKISPWPEEKEILIPKTKYRIKKIEDTGVLSADQTPQKRIILEAA